MKELNIYSSAKNLSKNPLGIIALFILLIYGVAALVVGFGNLSETSQDVFSLFLVLFPLIVLGMFYRLVTKHHNKLYAPSDFSSDETFIKSMELDIRKKYNEQFIINNIADKATDVISENEDKESIRNEISKALLKNSLLSLGSLTLKTLYFSLEDRVEIRIDKESDIALTVFDGKQEGGILQSYFHKEFFDLHNRGIITIKSTNPFQFEVTDYAKQAVKEIYEEVHKNLNDDKVPRLKIGE